MPSRNVVTAWVTLAADARAGAAAEVECRVTTTAGRTDARVYLIQAARR